MYNGLCSITPIFYGNKNRRKFLNFSSFQRRVIQLKNNNLGRADSETGDLEELNSGENVEIPDLQVASLLLVALQDRSYGQGFVNAGHHSARGKVSNKSKIKLNKVRKPPVANRCVF